MLCFILTGSPITHHLQVKIKLSILQNLDVKTVGENKPSLVSGTLFKLLGAPAPSLWGTVIVQTVTLRGNLGCWIWDGKNHVLKGSSLRSLEVVWPRKGAKGKMFSLPPSFLPCSVMGESQPCSAGCAATAQGALEGSSVCRAHPVYASLG